MTDIVQAFRLETQYRDYVWGGQRLRPGQITAEAWIVHESNHIISGPLSGKTLAEAANQYGEALLGKKSLARTGTRFPLLIKLLDCADWLSLQVHPNDQQAVLLEGHGQFGKTEAWHVLDSDPGSEILCGFQPGVSDSAVKQSVVDGSVNNYVQHTPLQKGDTIFIRAGTLHALGPGLLVYEVQQTSDITYRVFDWNRPASSGRKLHIDQSLAVLDPAATSQPIPEPEFVDGKTQTLITCPYFQLDIIFIKENPVAMDTKQTSFHALTLIEGEALVKGTDWQMNAKGFDTILIPAHLGQYEIQPIGRAKILKSSVE